MFKALILISITHLGRAGSDGAHIPHGAHLQHGTCDKLRLVTRDGSDLALEHCVILGVQPRDLQTELPSLLLAHHLVAGVTWPRVIIIIIIILIITIIIIRSRGASVRCSGGCVRSASRLHFIYQCSEDV